MSDTVTPLMPSTGADVVDILSRFDDRKAPYKSVMQQISSPPRRFYLTTLLVMVWALVGLTMAPMISVKLPQPWAWVHHTNITLTYVFQIPLVLLVCGLLGKRFGTITLALYGVAGLAGLPLFASGGGLSYLHTPSMGYVIGFMLVPYAMDNLITKAYAGTQWFQGRSVWLVLSVALGVLVIHSAGCLALLINAMLTPLTLYQATQWMLQLTVHPLAYDLAFGLVALGTVRLCRLLFWFCLY